MSRVRRRGRPRAAALEVLLLLVRLQLLFRKMLRRASVEFSRRQVLAGVAATPLPRCSHMRDYHAGARMQQQRGKPLQLQRRWLSSSSGVSPELYERLGATPHETAAELQAAYAAACDKVPRGPLAVLELAQLSEALRATLLVAPLTNMAPAADVGDQSWRSAGQKAAGGLAMPTGLKAETEDDADKRVNLAMQKAIAYKRAKAAGAKNPKAVAEAEITVVVANPVQTAEQAAETTLAAENAQEEADATPRWVELTREIEESRPRIIAKLKGSLEVAAKLGMPKKRQESIAAAEEAFKQSVRFRKNYTPFPTTA